MADEDIISTLPEEILCDILSFLETKQANATTILSKTWKHIWRSVPKLVFDEVIDDDDSNDAFTNFVNSVLFGRPTKCPIKSFSFCVLYEDDLECENLTKWLKHVVECRVESLHLNVTLSTWPILPISVLTCKTLVVLKLSFCRVEHYASVYLPCLKEMELDEIDFRKPRDIMQFLNGCPTLEVLLLPNVYYMGSPFYTMDCLSSDEWKRFSLNKLTRADVDSTLFYFPLRAIHNVQSLLLFYDQEAYYHKELMPVFKNLTQLDLYCLDYSKDFILSVLNNCPKLETLEFAEMKPQDTRARKEDESNWVFPDVAPECLLSHLRKCTLYRVLGLHGELMLASYILRSANVLKTMEIWNLGKGKQKRALVRKLSAVPKGSPTCKLKVINHSYHNQSAILL